MDEWLSSFLNRFNAVAGTVHVRHGEALELVASRNIPEQVLLATRIIPKGKGMAGLAWERATPVQTCNLKEDETGDVRPGAKAVNAQAAVALPVSGPSGELRAVVGVAWMHSEVLSETLLAELQQSAAELPDYP